LHLDAVLTRPGTAGLGQYIIQTLAKHGSPRIFFTGRNAKAADELIQTVKAEGASARLTFVQCDLTDLASTSEAGARIARETDKLDWVFCNAGVMAIPAGLTKDGWEVQFGVNHLGHATLIKKLLPTLERTAKAGSDVRVIFNTSLGFKFASTIAFDTLNTKQESMVFGAFKRYGQSKLANILYSAELARRYPSITFASVHPGVIKTGLVTGLSGFNRYFTEATTYFSQIPIEEGAKNQLWAASVDKSKIVSGEYYQPVGQPGGHTAASQDAKLREDLYAWTEKVTSRW
jgi:NAD(P)-dependent dehydrogenase (short-subunit alcohol dehydrogenase family)